MSAESYSVRSRRGLSPLLSGIGVMLLSVCMLAGGFLTSRLDAVGVRLLPSPIAALSPTPFLPTLTPTSQPTAPPPAAEPPSVTETDVPAATALPTTPAAATACPYPAGWVIYVVQRGDTLSSLARQTGITTATLMQANCLSTSAIYVGQHLYLPSHPSPTLPYRCGPPLDWIIYYVQPGETLFSLARYFGISVEDIRLANCLTGYTIYVGQPLYLPPLLPMPVPTFTPTPVPTTAPAPTAPPPPPPPPPAPTNTPTRPTATPTPMPATATPTPTPTYPSSPIDTPTL